MDESGCGFKIASELNTFASSIQYEVVSVANVLAIDDEFNLSDKSTNSLKRITHGQ